MFLHAESPHSTERIKWRQSSDSVCVVTAFPHCTLSWMISYLLLLNEHKDVFNFGLVSMTQIQCMITTHPGFFTPFSYDSQKTNSVTHLALGFYIYKEKKIQYFEYDACWTRCLNQIYENTNLHLLSVWRGFPYRNKGLGFPKPKLEVHKWNKSLILTPKQTPFIQ